MFISQVYNYAYLCSVPLVLLRSCPEGVDWQRVEIETKMLTKIISGGQEGADEGGLEGAYLLGIATGGTAPLYYRTHTRCKPELLRDKYGLKQSTSWAYPPRTEDNVRDSDATVWVGRKSPGYYCTLKACTKLGKTMLDNPTAKELSEWCHVSDIGVLNVAGNRETKNPGIYERTKSLIMEAFK